MIPFGASWVFMSSSSTLVSVLNCSLRSQRSRYGSRAAVLRRNEGTRFSSRSDDEVGGYLARSARSER
jgi:hypothetical protein